MRTLPSTLALVTCIVFSASAQKFRPGYYITASGDSVKKDIFLQMKKGNIEKVVTPEGLFLTPGQIQGMGQDNIHYVSRKVSVDKSPDAGTVTDTVFLEIMSRGKMSLLTMIDENDKAHFYIENDFGVQELSTHVNRTENGVPQTRVDIYKSVLKGIFPTCANLFPSIDKTIFSRKGIQSIYNKLYTCRYTEAPPALKQQESDVETDFGILAGVSSSKIDFIGPKTFVNDFVFSKRSANPVVSVFLETRFSRKKNVALRHELGYLSYNCTSEEYGIDQYHSNRYEGVAAASYLRYSLILKYYLAPTKLRPFIDFGGSPAYAISKTEKRRRLDTTPVTETDLFENHPKVEVAFFGGIGATYEKFGLDIRYENATNISPGSDTSVKRKTLYLTLSYRLMKK